MNDIPDIFVIGRKYHCSWARERGMVWILRSFDVNKNEAVLQTPKTKKKFTTQLSSLRDTNFYILARQERPDVYYSDHHSNKRAQMPKKPEYVRAYKEFDKSMTRDIEFDNLKDK